MRCCKYDPWFPALPTNICLGLSCFASLIAPKNVMIMVKVTCVYFLMDKLKLPGQNLANFSTLDASVRLRAMQYHAYLKPGNTEGGSIIVLLTSCLTGLESAV